MLPSPAPSVFIDSIADGAIFVTLRYWAKTGDWWSLSRDMVKRVKLAFDEKGRPATLSDTSDATPTKKSNGRTAAEKQAATRQ